MRSKNFFESLQYATAGILYAFRTQRNLRAHMGVGALVLLFSHPFALSRAELTVVLLTIGVVIAAELFNTAVELAVDLASEDYHPLAELAKNVAAGGVLATAVTALLVGYTLFFDRLRMLQPHGLRLALSLPSVALIVGIVLVVTLVVVMKSSQREFRLRGGMPSFHSALAGALATGIFFVGDDGISSLIGLVLAAMVVQSRVEGGVHTLEEALAGAVLGVLVMTLVFRVFVL